MRFRTICLLIFIAPLFLTIPSYAKSPMGGYIAADVYGTSDAKTELLLKKYKKQLNQFGKTFFKIYQSPGDSVKAELEKKREQLVKQIQSDGPYSYVNIAHIYYPGKDTLYLSIDLVEPQDNLERNTYAPIPNGPSRDPNHLFQDFSQYYYKLFELTISHQISPTLMSEDCPVYHCLSLFKHKDLKPFLKKFNRAEQYKSQLKQALKNDKDESHRATAAYLMAHLKDPKEIAQTLGPSLNDPSNTVRNAAMRVLYFLIIKTKRVEGIPFNLIVKNLNDRDTMSRNKALAVLYALVKNDDKYQPIVKHKLSHRLIALLKLKQPNEHNFAYIILKLISGKNYKDDNISAWQEWVNKNA